MPCVPILLLRQEARERYNIEVRERRQCRQRCEGMRGLTVIIVSREEPVTMLWPLSAVQAALCARSEYYNNFHRIDLTKLAFSHSSNSWPLTNQEMKTYVCM